MTHQLTETEIVTRLRALYDRCEEGHDDHLSASDFLEEVGYLLKPKKPVRPSYKCPCCKSTDVQVCLPAWFSSAGLEFVEADCEADIRSWFCESCGEGEEGEPDRNEPRKRKTQREDS